MQRRVLGLVIKVILIGKKGQKVVAARVDTGATKSSVDTNLAGEIGLGEEIDITTIKQVHGSSKRPVINGSIKIGEEQITSHFTLADRSHMKYKVLIGQNILKKGKFLIDPNK